MSEDQYTDPMAGYNSVDEDLDVFKSIVDTFGQDRVNAWDDDKLSRVVNTRRKSLGYAPKQDINVQKFRKKGFGDVEWLKNLGDVGGATTIYDAATATADVYKAKTGDMNDPETVAAITRLKQRQFEDMRGTTMGYNIGTGIAQVPAFGAEIALSGGTLALAKKGGKALIRKGVTEAVDAVAKTAAKQAERGVVSTMLRGAGRAAAELPGRAPVFAPKVYAQSVLDTLPSDIQITQDEAGQLQAMLEDPQMGFGDALLRNALITGTEVWSEGMGPTIGAVIDKMAPGARKALTGKLVGGIARKARLGGKPVVPAVQRAFQQMQIGSFGEEWLEEDAGQFAQYAITQLGDMLGIEGMDLGVDESNIYTGGNFKEEALTRGAVLAVPQAGRGVLNRGVRAAQQARGGRIDMITGQMVMPREQTTGSALGGEFSQEQYYPELGLVPVEEPVQDLGEARPTGPTGLTGSEQQGLLPEQEQRLGLPVPNRPNEGDGFTMSDAPRLNTGFPQQVAGPQNAGLLPEPPAGRGIQLPQQPIPSGPVITAEDQAEIEGREATIQELMRGGMSEQEARLTEDEFSRKGIPLSRDERAELSRLKGELGPVWKDYMTAANGNIRTAIRMAREDAADTAATPTQQSPMQRAEQPVTKPTFAVQQQPVQPPANPATATQPVQATSTTVGQPKPVQATVEPPAAPVQQTAPTPKPTPAPVQETPVQSAPESDLNLTSTGKPYKTEGAAKTGAKRAGVQKDQVEAVPVEGGFAWRKKGDTAREHAKSKDDKPKQAWDHLSDKAKKRVWAYSGGQDVYDARSRMRKQDKPEEAEILAEVESAIEQSEREWEEWSDSKTAWMRNREDSGSETIPPKVAAAKARLDAAERKAREYTGGNIDRDMKLMAAVESARAEYDAAVNESRRPTPVDEMSGNGEKSLPYVNETESGTPSLSEEEIRASGGTPVWEATWSKHKGVDVLRIDGSRYVAAPNSGRKNARVFDIVDVERGELVTQLQKDEVSDWLVRAARSTENLPPTGVWKGEAPRKTKARAEASKQKKKTKQPAPATQPPFTDKMKSAVSMTQSDYVDNGFEELRQEGQVLSKWERAEIERGFKDQHRRHVARAVKEGIPVPSNVLADYPDVATTPIAQTRANLADRAKELDKPTGKKQEDVTGLIQREGVAESKEDSIVNEIEGLRDANPVRESDKEWDDKGAYNTPMAVRNRRALPFMAERAREIATELKRDRKELAKEEAKPPVKENNKVVRKRGLYGGDKDTAQTVGAYNKKRRANNISRLKNQIDENEKALEKFLQDARAAAVAIQVADDAAANKARKEAEARGETFEDPFLAMVREEEGKAKAKPETATTETTDAEPADAELAELEQGMAEEQADQAPVPKGERPSERKVKEAKIDAQTRRSIDSIDMLFDEYAEQEAANDRDGMRAVRDDIQEEASKYGLDFGELRDLHGDNGTVEEAFEDGIRESRNPNHITTGNTTAGVTETLKTGRFGMRVKGLLKSGKLKIVQTAEELPGDSTARSRNGRIEGAYDPKTDTMYIVADGVAAGDEQGALMHEAFHRAMERGALRAILDDLAKLEMKAQRKGDQGMAEWFREARRRAQVAKDGKGYAEELAAYALNDYDAAPKSVKDWVKKFIAKVKAALFTTLGVRIGKVDPAMLHEIALRGLNASFYKESKYSREWPTRNSRLHSIGDNITQQESEDIRYSTVYSQERTPEQVRELSSLIDSGDAMVLSEWLAGNAATKEHRELASKLTQVMDRNEITGEVKLEFGKLPDGKGGEAETKLGKSWQSTIRLNRPSSEANKISSLSDIVLLHELIHGLTTNIISGVETGTIYGPENRDIVNAVKDLGSVLTMAQTWARHAARGENELIGREDVPGVIRGWVEGRTNALDDSYELLSYALTDTSVQEFLSKVPYPKGKTLWDAFVTVIKDALGLNKSEGTALEGVLGAAQTIFNSDINSADLFLDEYDREAMGMPPGRPPTSPFTTNDIRYSVADAEVDARDIVKDFISRKKKVAGMQDSNQKPDFSVWDILARTPNFFYGKVWQAADILKAMGDSRNSRAMHEQHMFEGSVEEMKSRDGNDRMWDYTELKNFYERNKEGWKKVNDYIYKSDLDAKSPKAKFNGDTKQWEVFDSNNKKVATFNENQEDLAWDKAYSVEFEELNGKSMDEAEAAAVWQYRTIADRMFKHLRTHAQRATDRANELGIPEPSLDIWEPDAAGKPKKKTITLMQAVRQMGDQRGHYMPRIRKGGYYTLWAKKDGKTIMEIFDTDGLHIPLTSTNLPLYGRRKRAAELQEDGWEVTFERNKRLSEEVYLDASLVAMNEMIQEATKRLDKREWQQMSMEKLGINAGVEEFPTKDGGTVKQFVIHMPKNAKVAGLFKKEFSGGWYGEEQGLQNAWRFKKRDGESLEMLGRHIAQRVAMTVYPEMASAQAYNEVLTGQIARMMHERGSRQRMIRRSDKTGEDVVQGYETDSFRALTLAVKSTAGGTAKREFATTAMKIMSGTTKSWADWQEENPLPEDLDPKSDEYKEAAQKRWEAYKDWTEGQKIDSALQSNAYKEVQSSTREFLRNQEPFERTVGVIRGIASLKYLSGFAPAITNFSAIPTTVVGTLIADTKAGLGEIGKSLTKEAKTYSKIMLTQREAKRKGVRSLDYNHELFNWMNAEDRKVYAHIRDNKWDEAQWHKESSEALRNNLEREYRNIVDFMLMPFAITEQINRGSTIASAYKLLKKAKPDAKFEDLMAEAKLLSDKAHGVYGKEDDPSWVRGASLGSQALRSAYMFKKFPHTYLQNLGRITGRMIKEAMQHDTFSGKVKHINKRDLASIGWLLAAPGFLAGGGATMLVIPASAVATGIFMGLGMTPPDDPEEAFYDWVAQEFGTTTSNYARHGLLGLGGRGVNLKGSLSIGITDLPTSVVDLLGAPASVFKDVGQGVGYMARGDMLKGAEKLAPRIAASPIRALREYREGATMPNNQPVFYGDEQVRPTLGDALLRAVGFNPSGMSAKTEEQWAERKSETKRSEQRSNIYAQVRSFLLTPAQRRDKGAWADILAQIDDYNTSVRAAGDQAVPPITVETLKSQIRRLMKPSKRERIRAGEQVEEGNTDFRGVTPQSLV